MKIVAVESYRLVLPVREIYGGAAGFLEDCRALIVRVETDNGIEGWGEATQGRPGNTYETLETMEIMAQAYFAPALLGMDIRETGSIVEKLHRVRSGHPITKAAIEIALFDAVGKAYSVPLCRLLGGPYRSEIALWESSVALAPWNARGHNNLGYAYQVAGRAADARREYQAALLLDPRHPKARLNLHFLQ